jgi:hypothetical protein
MKTEHITIGKNPELTYFVLRAAAHRAEQAQAKQRFRRKWFGWIPFLNSKP